MKICVILFVCLVVVTYKKEAPNNAICQARILEMVALQKALPGKRGEDRVISTQQLEVARQELSSCST